MSGKNLLQRAEIAAILCFLVFPALSCHKKTEEERIKAVIEEVQKAVEQKDVKKVIHHISRTYSDHQGFTYETVKGLLLSYFFRHGGIHVYLPTIEISVKGETATTVAQAVLSGNDSPESAALLPESLGVYQFNVTLQKEQDDWKVTSALWRRMGGGETGAAAGH